MAVAFSFSMSQGPVGRELFNMNGLCPAQRRCKIGERCGRATGMRRYGMVMSSLLRFQISTRPLDVQTRGAAGHSTSLEIPVVPDVVVSNATFHMGSSRSFRKDGFVHRLFSTLMTMRVSEKVPLGAEFGDFIVKEKYVLQMRNCFWEVSSYISR